MSKLNTWQAVQDRLISRRAALNEEIAAYPGPITGCDAQFNHMLELRSDLNAELVRLETAKSNDTNMLEQFMESSPFLAGVNGEKQ
jgi:hypothetical protein